MIATSIPRRLHANASDGRCPRDSLNLFSHIALLMASAWRPASNLTLIAS